MKLRRKRLRFWLAAISGLAALTSAGFGVYRLRGQAVAVLPIAPARKGDFLVIVRCRGELRAKHSVQISAPLNVPSLAIVWLAPPGAITAGQPMIRFDPSNAKQQLQEKEAALKQAQASLEQAVAEARITAEQDRRDLSSARYDVERARLEVSKAEIVSKLQGEVSKVDFNLAGQKLRVQESTVDLHQASDKAKIASLTRQRDQAQADAELIRSRLAKMEIAAPISGVFVYLSNFSQGWMNAKPFKAGDQVWPGAALAEIPDLSTLEMEGKVEEIDRGRIAAGNDVRVRIDSLPELNMVARLNSISPLTEQSFEWPPTRSFRAFAHIAKPDPRMRTGMNGAMDIVVNRISSTLSVPAKALFTHRGKPVVYVKEKAAYRAVQVQVLARNPDEVAVSGIPENAMVTLVDVEQKGTKR